MAHVLLYSVITKKSTMVAILQNQIDEKNERVSRIASSRVALEEIANDEAVVRSYFISENDIVAFIDGLQARGLSQGAVVKVLSVSTGNINMKPSFILTLTVTGAFDAVMRTAGMIEYSPYNLTISKFSLFKEDKKTWKANIELVVGSISKP